MKFDKSQGSTVSADGSFFRYLFQFVSTILCNSLVFIFSIAASFFFYRVRLGFTLVVCAWKDWNLARWAAAICSPSFELHGSWSVYKSLIYAARDILVINRATIIHVSNGTISSRGRYPRISRTFQSSFSSVLSSILGDTREALFAQGIVFPLLATFN